MESGGELIQYGPVSAAKVLEWTETALGTPFYHDGGKESELHAQPHELLDTPSFRSSAGKFALREVMRARWYARNHAKANDASYEPRAFTANWQFTKDSADTLKLDAQERLRQLGRQVIVLNNLEEGRHYHHDYLRVDQKGAVDALIEYAGFAPNMQEITGNPENTARGILLVSPTGTGKTVMEGMVIEHAGIGEPASARDPKPLRALIIATTVANAEQLAGKRGASALQRAAPQARVTLRHGSENDTSGDVVVATAASLKQDIKENKLSPNDFDITLFDEVHHILEPQMQELLRSGKLGNLIMGFTATEKYNELRRVQDLLPYTRQGDTMISYIRQGILNGAQLFTFRVDFDHNTVTELKGHSNQELTAMLRKQRDSYVVDAARTLASEGRRTVIYCEASRDEDGGSLHSRQLATQLAEAEQITDAAGHTRSIRAAAVGSFQSEKKNEQVLEAFDRGDLDVLLTVSMLSEGWDAQVNAVIFACNTKSELLKRQQIGRGIRFNKDFPVTVYMEFLAVNFGRHDRLYSMLDAFGLSEVQQGHIIGQLPESGALYRNPRYTKLEDKTKLVLSEDDLPESLRELAKQVDRKLLENITIATPAFENKEPIPEGSATYADLLEIDPNYVSEYHLMSTLKRAGIGRVGRWERTKDGRRFLQYYYAPEAKTYLLENPQPEQWNRGELTIRNAAELLGVGETFLRNLIDDGTHHIETVTRLRRGIKGTYLGEKGVSDAAKILESIPFAADDEHKLKDLHLKLACGEAHVYKILPQLDIEPRLRRQYNPDSGRLVYASFVTQEEVDKIWANRHAFENADPYDMTVARISEVSQISRPGISKYVEAHRGQAIPKISGDKNSTVREHYPIEVAQDIIESSRKNKLSPHLITLSALSQLFGQPSHIIRYALKRLNIPAKNEPLQAGSPTICVEWSALTPLQKEFGHTRQGQLNPADFPTDESDGDLERIKNAYTIQDTYGESRVQLVAQDIVEQAKGTYTPPPEPIKADLPPKLIPRVPRSSVKAKEIIMPASQRTYSSNHPEAMDAEAISNFTGVPENEVAAFLQTVKIAGGLPPQKRVNQNKRLTLHYEGRALESILMGIMGMSIGTMAEMQRIPEDVVLRFLQAREAVPAPNGGYPQHYWQELKLAFQKPPRGWRRVMAVNDTDPDEVIRFVTQNGAKVAAFYNEFGEPETYLSPLAVKLLESQEISYPHPDHTMVNREEIATLGKTTPEAFDTWLHNHPHIKENMRWFTVRQGDKVLPHYDFKSVEAFITFARNASSPK